MITATRYESGREPATAELYESAMQMRELVRANSEAMLQAWTTGLRGMLNCQEHFTRFVGMRMQKHMDMAREVSGCRDFEQLVDHQVAFGRSMMNDYQQEGEDLLQSTLDIIRDSARPLEARTEEAPHEVREAVAS